jgi:hypothetical protein
MGRGVTDALLMADGDGALLDRDGIGLRDNERAAGPCSGALEQPVNSMATTPATTRRRRRRTSAFALSEPVLIDTPC